MTDIVGSAYQERIDGQKQLVLRLRIRQDELDAVMTDITRWKI